jgi:4'-phosphopantetheinyl transferase
MELAVTSWRTPPAVIKCLPGEVHLWRIPLDTVTSMLNILINLLTEDEWQRSTRFLFPHDQAHFISAHAALRLILSRYTALPPARICYKTGEMGKPFLAEDTPLRFNLSHSGKIALVGVCLEEEIGVDVEWIHSMRALDLIAKNFFAPSETEKLLAQTDPEQQRAFFDCWTRKEAFIKSTGKGISFPLDQFEVEFNPGQPARLLSVFGEKSLADQWALFDIPCGKDLSAALVVPQQSGNPSGWRLRYWQFHPADEIKIACDKWGELFVVQNRTAWKKETTYA